MKLKKPILIIGIAIIVVAILISTILMITISKKDLTDIVGKEVSLSEGLSYCNGISDLDLNDSFSKIYSSKTTIKVVDFDDEKALATVEIQSPPLKDIMSSCIPSEASDNYDEVFKNYMASVEKAIQSTKKEDMVLTTIECSVDNNDGNKLIINKEFVSAVYPDIYTLLNNILLNSLDETEK